MILYSDHKGCQETFEKIITNVTNKLNDEASIHPNYYKSKGGTKLEAVIYNKLKNEALGTTFEGRIRRASTQRFPDIIANNFFGVEVKTTKNKSWSSTGSSIVESTRIEGIEKIYLLFGKLSDPVGFKLKPYEDCMSDIVVTHSPRYRIDMNLSKNETIFEKMNVSYDDFRNNEDSINIVKNYYKENLKPGQDLWWIDSEPVEEQAVSPIVKMWNTLDIEEKRKLQVKGYCWFPEIFSNNQTKYTRFALWLVTQKGVVATSLRDIFTAGGRKDIKTLNNTWKNQPQIIFKMLELKNDIIREISNASPEQIREFWRVEHRSEVDNLKLWINLITNEISNNRAETKRILYDIFDL